MLVIIAASSFGANVAVNEKNYVLAAAAVVVVIISGVIELFLLRQPSGHITGGRLSDREFLKLASQQTKEALRLRLARLQTALGWQATTTVSMTIHLAVTRGDCTACHTNCSLVQLLGYVGHRKGGEGRVNSDLKGIIGRCLRTRAPQSVNFSNAPEYSRMMTKEFGYYLNEVSFHDHDGRSYLCSPIGQEGGAMAVLYIYSTQPHTFPNTATEYDQIQQIFDACSDIAHILAEDRLVRAAIS